MPRTCKGTQHLNKLNKSFNFHSNCPVIIFCNNVNSPKQSTVWEDEMCFFRQFSSSAEDAAKGLQLTYPTSAHNSFMFLYFPIHSAPDIQRCNSQFLKMRYCHPDLRFTPLDACVAQEKNVPPRMMTVYVSW